MPSTTPYSLETASDAFSKSVTKALEGFRKGVDEQLRKKDNLIRELQAKIEEQQLENASLQTKIAAVSERKTLPLKASIEALDLSNDDIYDHGDVEEYGHVAKDKKRAPITHEEYDQLALNTNALYKSRNDMEKTAKKFKARAKEWKEYAEKLERRGAKTAQHHNQLLRRPTFLSTDTSSSRPSTANSEKDIRRTLFEKTWKSPLQDVALSTQDRITENCQGASENLEPDLPEAHLEQRGLSSTAENPTEDRRTEIPSSSQTTDSETQTQHFPSDNTRGSPSSPPVFVSEKVLKRKRGAAAPTPTIKGPNQKGNPAKAIKIKSEPNSSPQKPLTARKLNRVETLDLDEVGDRIDTPRKRPRMQKLLLTTGSFKAGQIDLRALERPKCFPHAIKDEPLERPHALDDGVENFHPNFIEDLIILPEDQAFDETVLSESIHNPGLNEQTPSRLHPSHVLRPISTNQKILPRTSNVNEKQRRRDPERGAKALHIFAEDGNYSTQHTESKSRGKSLDSPLDRLLEDPAPARKQLASPASTIHRKLRPDAAHEEVLYVLKNHHSRYTPEAQHMSNPNPNVSKLQAEPYQRLDQISENEHTPIRGRSNPHSNGSSARPPLRSKPVNALNTDDFKLNPKARGGLDLAYADPIRGREARGHLDGCTDPTCAQCGDQLRALAAELPVTVGSALFASTQDGDLTEDEKLLKYYLGDTFDRERIARLQPKKRDNLILQAKAQLIAQRHIRHRVKPMGRAKSPPGFWDYDMPTTQELEAQREETERREKGIIAERYREAMRPGGRWIFRDE